MYYRIKSFIYFLAHTFTNLEVNLRNFYFDVRHLSKFRVNYHSMFIFYFISLIEKKNVILLYYFHEFLSDKSS